MIISVSLIKYFFEFNTHPRWKLLSRVMTGGNLHRLFTQSPQQVWVRGDGHRGGPAPNYRWRSRGAGQGRVSIRGRVDTRSRRHPARSLAAAPRGPWANPQLSPETSPGSLLRLPWFWSPWVVRRLHLWFYLTAFLSNIKTSLFLTVFGRVLWPGGTARKSHGVVLSWWKGSQGFFDLHSEGRQTCGFVPDTRLSFHSVIILWKPLPHCEGAFKLLNVQGN